MGNPETGPNPGDIYREDGSADLNAAEKKFSENKEIQKDKNQKKQGFLDKHFPYNPERRKLIKKSLVFGAGLGAARVGLETLAGTVEQRSDQQKEEMKKRYKPVVDRERKMIADSPDIDPQEKVTRLIDFQDFVDENGYPPTVNPDDLETYLAKINSEKGE